jgi:hypothetical protein
VLAGVTAALQTGFTPRRSFDKVSTTFTLPLRGCKTPASLDLETTV